MALKVEINDKTYEAEKGEYILEACRRNNITIPTLCHHEGINGIGSCRLCVVEINEGNGSKVVASCVYPLGKDCTIFTESEKIKNIRKTILSMLKARAPEGKRLSDLCQLYGVEEDGRFTIGKTGSGKSGKKSPAQKRLESSCILCGICTQACVKLGTGAISTVSRGVTKKVSTPFDEPSADCIGCGSCAAVCPTGAIECTESGGNRTIWGRKFRLINCASCSRAFATEEEYSLSLKNAGVSNLPVLCEICRRKGSAAPFAAAFGERV